MFKNWNPVCRQGRLVNIAIVVFWLVMMGFLVRKTVYEGERPVEIPEAHKLKEIESLPLKDQWMGIYLGEKKIGYSHTLLKKTGFPRGGYFLKEECHFQMKVGGQTHKVTFTGESILDKGFYPYFFVFVFFTDLGKVTVKGKIKEGKAKVRMSSAGKSREETIDLEGNPFLTSSADFLIASQGLEVGKRYSLSLFDPQTFQVKPIVVQVKDKVRLGSEKAYIIEKDYRGIITTSYINERGDTLKEEGPLGLRMVKEIREKARMMGPGSSPDLMEVASIKSKVLLNDPRNSTYLKVRLRIRDKSKKMRGRIRGGIREIRAVKFEEEDSLNLPLKDDEFNKYLTDTRFIQSEEEEIRRLARQIVGNQRNAWKAAREISTWVYRNISKVRTFSIPSALEVLEARRGDCNEHSVLFAALARAAGIPTRLIAGIVYLRGNFYYHAWAEVFVGKWVALDPTFGQTVVDATHIKLIEGGLSEQMELLRIVGKLNVEILEVEG